MSEFVEVTVEATGEKQNIPAHWLDHPVLSKGFRKTTKAAGDSKAKTAQKEN